MLVDFKAGKDHYPEKDFELVFEDTQFSETSVSYSDLENDAHMMESQKSKLAEVGLPLKGAVLQFMPDMYRWKREVKHLD